MPIDSFFEITLTRLQQADGRKTRPPLIRLGARSLDELESRIKAAKGYSRVAGEEVSEWRIVKRLATPHQSLPEPSTLPASRPSPAA